MTDQPKKGKKTDKVEKKQQEVDMGANSIDNITFGGGANMTNDQFGEDFTNEQHREPNIIHLHYQQRTTRKCLTIIQGLPDDLDFKKILRAYKKMYNCNGTIVEDEEMGTVIQLQGDKRKDVAKWMLEEGIANKEEIKVHGF